LAAFDQAHVAFEPNHFGALSYGLSNSVARDIPACCQRPPGDQPGAFHLVAVKKRPS